MTQSTSERNTSGLAITSMIMGILSVLGAALMVIPPLLAVIFGHISLSQCNKDSHLDGRGMAIAGLVMGYISSIPAVILALGMFSAMAIPAFQKVRENSQEQAIINNARQLQSAADQFFLEKSKDFVSYDELVQSGYIQDISAINSEEYPTVFKLDKPIEIKLLDGTTLTYPDN